MSESTVALTKKEYSRLLEAERRLSHIQPKSISERRKTLLETAGALKGMLPKDLVAWQRRVRAEWER